MAETPDPTRRTIDVLTRLALAADRLGIDSSALQPQLLGLGNAPASYARISLDTADRLALRVGQATPTLVRPGVAQLEVGSDGVNGAFAFGRRPFAADLALLSDVSADARTSLAQRLGSLGGGRCDAIARYSNGRWLAAVTHELSDLGPSPTQELVAVTSLLFTITGALGVPPEQRALLQQAHVVLAAGKGYTLWLSCDDDHVIPELTIEYRDVEWKHVVGLTDSLRPGTSSGPRLGVFAGAFDAPKASAFAITYGTGDVATVAIAVERTTQVAS
ncbi:MAG: hypothetical protein IPQ07_07065 [Myxococcales bacterium]|nr:hypothetical protein [Myxococcales bacterium]